MTRVASVFLAIGLALAGGLYGGIWEYGDGFIFNRFNGEVIYVDLQDEGDAVRFETNRSGPSRFESRASLRGDAAKQCRWRSSRLDETRAGAIQTLNLGGRGRHPEGWVASLQRRAAHEVDRDRR
jgi:hypothetical protein